MTTQSPCGWAITKCGCGKCWDDHTPATRATAAALATGLMWAATGRRYGLCEITTLPCNPPPRMPLYQTFPVTLGRGGYSSGGWPDELGALVAPGSSSCTTTCQCSALCEVALDGPVNSVIAVTVDGLMVPPVAYEIHDRRLLVRKDGLCWPTCQVYGSQIPGFAVTYRRGLVIPAAIQAAAEVLACEYAKACTGADCALPPKIRHLSRQGVDVEVAAQDWHFGDHVRTGIAQVDNAILADNPGARTQPPQIMSPDQPTARMITWAGGS